MKNIFPLTVSVKIDDFDFFVKKTNSKIYIDFLDGDEDTDEKKEAFYNGDNKPIQDVLGNIWSGHAEAFFSYEGGGVFEVSFIFECIEDFTDFHGYNDECQWQVIDDLKRQELIYEKNKIVRIKTPRN